MNKIYVVEGQDRCGKSSISDQLRTQIKNSKILMIHSGKPPKGVDPERWTREYYSALSDVIIATHMQGYDVILDRSWIGETVYGPIYRDVHIPLYELEDKLTRYGGFKDVVLVLLTDAPSNLVARSDGLSLSDDLVTLGAERERFLSAFNSSSIHTKLLIDWRAQDFSQAALSKYAQELISG